MLVKIIEKVPEVLFKAALEEIQNIDWKNIETDQAERERRTVPQFATSTSIHLRIQDPILRQGKNNSYELAKVLKCQDSPLWADKFHCVKELAEWVFKTVSGKTKGRIMITNLEPRGSVGIHIDVGDYPKVYSRFHVPFKTNQGVVFHSNQDSEKEHMPLGYLCRLNNILPHQLDNNSDENRIHLIYDIEIEGGNQPF